MSERKTQSSAGAPIAGAPADEHLPTTRLPPSRLPVPPLQPPGRPAGVSSVGPPPPAPISQPVSSGSASEPPVSLPLTKGSRLWRRWAEAITSLFGRSESRPAVPTVVPPITAEKVASATSDERSLSLGRLRRRVGAASTAIGLTLVVLGVALGLRGAPAGSSIDPVVIAGLLIARALTGLGVLAFGTWLLRLGGRLLLEKP
jgi:hypothetical protein